MVFVRAAYCVGMIKLLSFVAIGHDEEAFPFIRISSKILLNYPMPVDELLYVNILVKLCSPATKTRKARRNYMLDAKHPISSWFIFIPKANSCLHSNSR